MSTIDWASLRKSSEDATRPPDPGEYLLEVTDCKVSSAASSGNPMLKATLKVVQGPAAGKTVLNNFNLTVDNPVAMSIFFRHMDALGLGSVFFDAGPDLEQVANALKGRRAMFTLSIRQFQGRDFPQVDGIKPVIGQPPVGSPVSGALPTVTPSGPGTVVPAMPPVPNQISAPAAQPMPPLASSTTPSTPSSPPVPAF